MAAAKFDRADVVGMVVGEPDRPDAPALGLHRVERRQQALLFFRVRSGGIDQHQLFLPEQEGIGVGRGRQGGGAQRHQDDPGPQLDAAHGADVGFFRIEQPGARAARTHLLEHPQEVHDGGRRHRFAGLPLGQRRLRLDPFAGDQLAFEDLRLEPDFGGPVEEEEAVVETHRPHRRRQPSAGKR